MHNPGLDQSAFTALGESTTSAFLAVADAITPVADRYSTEGLYGATAKGGVSDSRRVARPVRLPEGTRLYKLTAWKTGLDKTASGAWERSRLSSWWSPFACFGDSDLSAAQVFETAVLNQVTMRDYVRFAAAVSLDWNPLTYYTEVRVTGDVGAFWGQFAPQSGLHDGGTLADGLKVVEVDSPSGTDEMVVYADDGDEVYLPPVLGGTGAWQLYVPDFSKDWIDPGAVVNLRADDTAALAAHLGIGAERIAELRAQGKTVRR